MKKAAVPESAKRRGRKRVYNVEQTKAAILDAAEKTFAEDGYNGVSVDTIAQSAGYNKSLIFQYFTNKKGLYTAVLAKADDTLAALLKHSLEPMRQQGPFVLDRADFRSVLESMFGSLFDYMVEHPRFARIISWEQSDRWSTFETIASRFEPRDLPKLDALFSQARNAGYLRSDVDAVVCIVVAMQASWATVVSLPLYGRLAAGRDESHTLMHLRDQLVHLLVHGVMYDGGTE